ncbi:hypothetical protein [Roseomonas chloroacetimidivorans]|uniref:hypothetical protein n=1 Tax=Roseomonas chloroacetimidivorans TaxID=1766656 RepID=UPI003C78A0CC
MWRPELVERGVSALMREPAIGAVAISIAIVSPDHVLAFLRGVVAARTEVGKPVVLFLLGDGSPLPPALVEAARTERVVLSRSADRSLRALGHVLRRLPPPTPDQRAAATLPPSHRRCRPCPPPARSPNGWASKSWPPPASPCPPAASPQPWRTPSPSRAR